LTVADEPSWDDIFTSQPQNQQPAPSAQRPSDAPLSRRQLREQETARGRDGQREQRPPKKKRRLTWLWVLIAILALLAGGAGAVWFTFETQIRGVLGWEEPNDFEGTGTGEVVITIKNGQTGEDVATTLHKAGVTRSFDAFYSLLLEQDPPVSFQPGSFALKKEMSAKAALEAIQDPENKVVTRVVLPEGTTVKGVIGRLAEISEATGVSQADLEAAAADYTSYGLPAEAPSLEGYLFPATYTLEPGISAHDIFQTFVDEMFRRTDALGIAPADRHRILTLASITQKEGLHEEDFYKIARVWDNRIAIGMNLQSDATVSYGVGGTTIETKPEERADTANMYNTYANPGLPIGPISNPGEVAIEATLAPADGTWLYFVLINGETGETKFSTTAAEHNAGVKEWQAWLRAHPGFDD
jgi:UPF0755 protein